MACFELQDCLGVAAPIITYVDLSALVGTVVTLKDDSNHEAVGCWTVLDYTGDCAGSVFVDVYKCYTDCVDCLPVPEVPCDPKPRAVLPNYVTGICDPDIVDKAFCDYSEMMYKRMLGLRFGIANCCPKDDALIFIRKEKINLKLISTGAPILVPPPPPCISFVVDLEPRGSTFIEVTYTDCNGVIRVHEDFIGETFLCYQFCARETPEPTLRVFSILFPIDVTTVITPVIPIRNCTTNDTLNCESKFIRVFAGSSGNITYTNCAGETNSENFPISIQDVDYPICIQNGTIININNTGEIKVIANKCQC